MKTLREYADIIAENDKFGSPTGPEGLGPLRRIGNRINPNGKVYDAGYKSGIKDCIAYIKDSNPSLARQLRDAFLR